MTRPVAVRLVVGVGVALVMCLSLDMAARADELPLRKPGLWEMKTAKDGSGLPDITVQHCTDAATDKEMTNSVSPIAKQLCSKQDIVKTATGYTVDATCSMARGTFTSHSEVSGDFNSAYTMISVTHTNVGPTNLRDLTTKVEAKWLGECKPNQKPGDIIMPGGFKLNVKDAEKFKNLLKTN